MYQANEDFVRNNESRVPILIDIPLRRRYSVIMDKQHTAKHQMTDKPTDDFVPGTPAERIGLVWPLTLEVTFLSKRYDAKRRLQRHVTRIVRREG